MKTKILKTLLVLGAFSGGVTLYAADSATASSSTQITPDSGSTSLHGDVQSGNDSAKGSAGVSGNQNSIKGSATGEATATTPNVSPEIKTVRHDLQAARDEYEAKQKQLLDDLRSASDQQKAAIREELEQNRQDFEADIQQLRQQLADEVKQVSDDAKADNASALNDVKNLTK